MDRLPLLGGSYYARSPLAAATRSVNLFPEKNPKDSPTPVTLYQRPGLVPLAAAPVAGPGRNVWRASNGDGFAVIGSTVYYVAGDWTLTPVGDVSPGRANPCSLVDNGIEVMVVDGSINGWYFTLATKDGWTQIADPSFTGATRLDYIDTFILWNVLGTNQFRSTLSNQIVPMDPLYIAAKTMWPDPLQALIVNNHQINLIGQVKSENWYDSGDAQFPFAALPGSYTEHGTIAPYSVCAQDISTYWLGQDLQGIGLVFRKRGYDCQRISNHALDVAIRKMYSAGTIADCIGWTYQQDGHVFLVLEFPSGNQTWVYDEAVGEPEEAWHQRTWTNADGTLNRERVNGYASLYGKQVGIDWENGTLYSLDLDTYTDTVQEIAGPISWIRTFPHLMSGIDKKTGQAVLANGKMVRHERFQIDMQVGLVPDTFDDLGDPIQPKIKLRWSDDRGVTWGQDVLQTTGTYGEFITRPQWRGVGQAMDRVYEVEFSGPGPQAINGAWVEGEVLAQ